MQANLNPFDLKSTCMSHVQPEENNSRPPLLHTKMRAKLSLALHLANLTIIQSSRFLPTGMPNRSIRKWSDDADSKRQDCFDSTDWNMFWDSSDGIEYTTSVTGFINKCIDDVVHTVTVRTVAVSAP